MLSTAALPVQCQPVHPVQCQPFPCGDVDSADADCLEWQQHCTLLPTLYWPQCTVHIVKCAVCSAQCALCSVQKAVSSEQKGVCSV